MAGGLRILRVKGSGGVEMLKKRARMREVGGWVGMKGSGVEEPGLSREKGNEMMGVLGRADCTQLARHAWFDGLFDILRRAS